MVPHSFLMNLKLLLGCRKPKIWKHQSQHYYRAYTSACGVCRWLDWELDQLLQTLRLQKGMTHALLAWWSILVLLWGFSALPF